MRLMSEKNARRVAVILQTVCCLAVILALMVAVLVLLGRVELRLSTPQGYFNNALLIEKDHAATSRALIVKLSGHSLFLHIQEKLDFITWLGIALIGITRVFPMGYCFFVLAGFFKNIAAGEVFVLKNARILLRAGMVLIISSLLIPLLNGFVFLGLINALSANNLSIAINSGLSDLFFGGILLVMSYVFHYGIYLQDEADHTV